METTTPKIAHASAVSGILNRAGFRKAVASVGFETLQTAHLTEVWYTPARVEIMDDVLDEMARILRDKGYTVRKEVKSDCSMLEVSKDDGEIQNEAPVTVGEVRNVLAKVCFEATAITSGFSVVPFWSDNSLIRVHFDVKPGTTFEGGSDPQNARRHIENTLSLYRKRLEFFGYATERLRDSEGGIVDAILVGLPGTEFYTDAQRTNWALIKEERERVQMEAEQAQTTEDSLLLARQAIENDDLAYSTRKAGPQSIFVLYLVPFKQKVRRAEVFFDFDLGGYRVSYLGVQHERTFDLTQVVKDLGAELKD